MIDNDMHALVLAIVDGAMAEHDLELAFRGKLLDTDEATRTEIAYLIQDRFTHHGKNLPMSRVEAYMAHALKVEQWFVKRDDLDDELEALIDEIDECNLLSDDDAI